MLIETPEKETPKQRQRARTGCQFLNIPGANGAVCQSQIEDAHVLVSFDSVVQEEKEVYT